MAKKIWVHAEVVDGRIAGSAFELLSRAAELAEMLGEGTVVEATLIGSELGEETERLAGYARTVYLADDPLLRFYSPVSHVPLLTDLAAFHQPEIYLFAATATGSALGPAVAARLKTGMAAHCVDFRLDAEKLVALVPSFGGKVIGEILCPEKRPQMASVKPGIFATKAPVPAPLRIERLAPSAWRKYTENARLEVLAIEKRPPAGLPLNEAEVVVCGGLGVGSREHWALLEQLAESLGGATACTRPPVDEGWAEERGMVGTSGQSIRPRVYLGFGISGATHHVCGMSRAGVVISVNRDEEAPIFAVSDYRVVANVNEILPLLVEAVRRKTF